MHEFVEICLNLFAEKETPPAFFAGLGEVVERLSRDQLPAIETTISSRNANAFLARHGLTGHIHAVYRVDAPGSKAEKISMSRKTLLENGKQERVDLVGDTLSDVRAAQEASFTSIVVT